MAAVTIHSDFGAQKEEICHYFHLFHFYLPCGTGAGCHDLRFFGLGAGGQGTTEDEMAGWHHRLNGHEFE